MKKYISSAYTKRIEDTEYFQDDVKHYTNVALEWMFTTAKDDIKQKFYKLDRLRGKDYADKVAKACNKQIKKKASVDYDFYVRSSTTSSKMPISMSTGPIQYNGYYIEHNLYGEDEYTVQYCGDDVWFDNLESAKKFIDDINAGNVECSSKVLCSDELDDRFDFSFDDIEPEFWLKTTAEDAKIYLEDEHVIGNGAGMEYDVVIAIPRSEDHWQMEADIQENLDRHVREIVDGTDYYGSAVVDESNYYPKYANIPDDVYENSVFYSAIIEIVPYDNISPYGEFGIDFGVEDIESSKKINCDEEIVEEISEEVVNDPNAVRTYQNRKNENKFIETKKYKDGHRVARQYMKWETPEGTVKNYSGAKDWKNGRWHRANQHSRDMMLEDYDEV